MNCFCGCTEKYLFRLSLWLLPSPSPKYMNFCFCNHQVDGLIFDLELPFLLWPVWKLIIIKTMRYLYLEKLCFISFKSLCMLMSWLFFVNLTKLELYKKRTSQLRNCFIRFAYWLDCPAFSGILTYKRRSSPLGRWVPVKVRSSINYREQASKKLSFIVCASYCTQIPVLLEFLLYYHSIMDLYQEV